MALPKDPTKINNFYHMYMLEYLETGKLLGGIHKPALPAKEYTYIKDGFCFSLVLDWLNDATQAQSHYWNVLTSKPRDLDAYVQQNTSATQYDYYFQIAKWYYDYCIMATAPFNSNTLPCPIVLLDQSVDNREVIVADNTLFQVNCKYARKYYGWSFLSFGCKFYQGTGNVADLIACFDRPAPYAVLINIFLHSKVKNDHMVRHSIGMQRVYCKHDHMERYVFFDPQYGVFMTEQPRMFFANMINKWYGKKTPALYLICAQYNVCQHRPKDFP